VNIEKNTRGLVESAIVGVLTAILIFFIHYVPVIKIFVFLIAFPYIIVGKRNGIRFCNLSAVFAAILIGLLINPVMGIYVLLMGGAVASVIIATLEHGKRTRVALFAGTIAVIIALMAFLMFLNWITGIDAVAELKSAVSTLVSETTELYQSVGLDASELIAVKDNMLRLMPYMIVVSAFQFVLLNYFVAKAILNRTGTEFGTLSKFGDFIIPKSFLYGSLIIMGIIGILGIMGLGNNDAMIANVILIFMLIYVINGLAVVWHFADKHGIPKVVRVVLLIPFLFLSGGFLLGPLGFVDLVFNLRKLEVE